MNVFPSNIIKNKSCRYDQSIALFIFIYSLQHFFFFFLTCPHKRGEGGFERTSDLCFMRRGPQPIELPHGDATTLSSQLYIELVCSLINSIVDLHIFLYENQQDRINIFQTYFFSKSKTSIDFDAQLGFNLPTSTG